MIFLLRQDLMDLRLALNSNVSKDDLVFLVLLAGIQGYGITPNLCGTGAQPITSHMLTESNELQTQLFSQYQT